MPELDAIGDAVTGGMLGRAVEPRNGGLAGSDREHNCLNCGCELNGDYCHCCGQKSRIHRTLSAWWHDFLHSVLHLDGKFWRTMPMLALRPGELTRRYAHGERAKFLSPLALFLFTVFLMFAVFSLVGGPFDDASTAGPRADLEQESVSLRQRTDALERQRASLAAAGQPTRTVDAELEEVHQELQALGTARSIVLAPNSAPEGNTRTIDLGRGTIDTGWPWLDSVIGKARRNPELLIYKVQANAYKFSWALIPISVPFLWILFLHRGRYRQQFTAYDHLVFVTYSIAFMSLWLIAWAILSSAGLGGGLFDLAMIVIPPVHIYRQLRGAYALSSLSALWRTTVLLVFANVALLLFGLLLVAVGALA